MTQNARTTFWDFFFLTRLELWEEHLKDPIVALDKALKCVDLWLEASRQWLVAERAPAWFQRCGTNLCGKVVNPIWIRGTVCVCAQLPRIGMSQRSLCRTVSSSFFLLEERAGGSQ